MTPDQRKQLLDNVKDMLGEHCSGFVLIAEMDAGESDPGDTSTCHTWDGGLNLALGLSKRMVIRLEQMIIESDTRGDI